MRTAVINQCSDENFWYSGLVGFPSLAQFKVVDETEDDYIVKMENDYYSWKLAILKTDCLVIEK